MNSGKKTGLFPSRGSRTRSGGSRSAPSLRFCLGLALIAGLSVPALAASFKGVMGEMKQTTTVAKGVLSNFDQVKANALLHQYSAQALAADKLYSGGNDAKAADFHKRFAALAAAADSAKATDAASFRSAFTTIAAQCRSCHSAYK